MSILRIGRKNAQLSRNVQKAHRSNGARLWTCCNEQLTDEWHVGHVRRHSDRKLRRWEAKCAETRLACCEGRSTLYDIWRVRERRTACWTWSTTRQNAKSIHKYASLVKVWAARSVGYTLSHRKEERNGQTEAGKDTQERFGQAWAVKYARWKGQLSYLLYAQRH